MAIIYSKSGADAVFSSGGGTTAVQISTLTLPASPGAGDTVTVLADSSTVIPAGVEWDEGGEPTVAAATNLLITFLWNGTKWFGTYGLKFPDRVPPVAGIISASSITDSGFVITPSGASDAGGLHPLKYAYSTDGGTTYAQWQASAYTATGLASATAYTCVHKVRDAAGNVTTGTPIVVTTL